MDRKPGAPGPPDDWGDDGVLHKTLIGEGAEAFLPFAIARVRAYRRIFGPDVAIHKVYLIAGYQIEVQLAGRVHYVRIIAKSTLNEFEFFTSGKPVVTSTVTQEGVSFDNYDTAVIRVKLAKSGSALTATPSLLGNKRVVNTATVSKIGRTQQTQLHDEPVHYPGKSRSLFESWAPGHSHTGVYARAYTAQASKVWGRTGHGSLTTHTLRDILFDVPLEYNSGSSKVREALIRTNADWPRSSAIQTVSHATYGARSFAIYVDAYSQFHVFPLTAIAAVDGYNQNVPEAYVQMARVSFPSWAYQPTEKFADRYAADPAHQDRALVDLPEIDWKLHPDGTKACAVVYERVLALFDQYYFDSNPDVGIYHAAHRPTQATFNAFSADYTGVGARHYAQIAYGYHEERYSCAPGLIEVAINITLTGPNPQDFTMHLTTITHRRPTTSPYCTVVAGYSYINATGVTRGDLVTLDIERYQCLDWPFSNGMASCVLFSLKNLTTAGELRAFGGTLQSVKNLGGDIATFPAELVACNLEMLAFAVKTHSVECAGDFIAGEPIVAYFGVAVYTENVLREVLYPDTITTQQRDYIASDAAADARRIMAEGGTWTLLPLNDIRGWDDPDLAALRAWAQLQREQIPPTPANVAEAATVSADTFSWYWTLVDFVAPDELFDITLPNFGWCAYTNDMLQRMQLLPHTTFFVHPGGTWAFYNQEFVQNRNTSYAYMNGGPLGDWELTNVEHCIFDRVHFAYKGNTLDTTFLDLYNQALTNTPPTDSLVAATKDDLRAAFTKGEMELPGDPGTRWINLKVEWGGQTGYYWDMGVGTGIVDPNPYFESGGLYALSLGDLFRDTDSFYTTSTEMIRAARPITFSTCWMAGP